MQERQPSHKAAAIVLSLNFELDFEKERMRINSEYHDKILAREQIHKELLAQKDRLESGTRHQDIERSELNVDLDRVKDAKNEPDKETNRTIDLWCRIFPYDLRSCLTASGHSLISS